MQQTSMFDPADQALVGHAAIDAAHREFAHLVEAMRTAGSAESLAVFIEHAEAHFGLEEELMSRHDFPAHECHAAEHERVLASLREAGELLLAGDTDIVRELADALAEWFPGHSDYMDASLAAWVMRRTAGGAPVVLRRPARPADRAFPSLRDPSAAGPVAAASL